MNNSETRNDESAISNRDWAQKITNLLKSAASIFVRSGKKQIEHLFWNKKCPFCNSDVNRLPTDVKFTTCKNCNQIIYVKRHNDLIKLITEEEENDIKLHKSIDFTEISFDEYREIKNRFLLKNGDNYQRKELLLYIYSELIERELNKKEFGLLPLIYESKASLVKDNPGEYSENQRQYWIALIQREKQRFGEDKVAVIQLNGKECPNCREISKRKYYLMDDAVNRIQSLHTECLSEECGFIVLFLYSSEFFYRFVITEELIKKQAEKYLKTKNRYLSNSTSDISMFSLSYWIKNSGNVISKGDRICTINLYDMSLNTPLLIFDNFTVYSPENGLLEVIHQNGVRYGLKQKVLLCLIHKDFSESDISQLKRKRFINISNIEDDRFSGMKNIGWKSVMGQHINKKYQEIDFDDCIELKSNESTEKLCFTFNNLNSQDYLLIRYSYKDFRLSTASKIIFLFNNAETVEFILKDKPYEHSKGYDDNRQIVFYEAKIPTSLDKIEIFKNQPLTGWRIEVAKTSKIITGILQNADIQFGIQNFASDYLEIVQRETSTNHQPLQITTNNKEYISYNFPKSDNLKQYEDGNAQSELDNLDKNKEQILNILKDFDLEIDSISASIGPTVTLFEIIPAKGVRIAKIKSLEEDISLSLSALGIRIIAPMPGKGTIGIEIPNKNPQIVSLKSFIDSDRFQNSGFELPIALGKTIDNKPYLIDLTKMPHLLVAGATGQGKSVGLNVIITSLLFSKYPGEILFVLIDPKKVEFSVFNDLKDYYLFQHPRMKNAILTETDQIIEMLGLLCTEMDNRFKILVEVKAKNITEYNQRVKSGELSPNKSQYSHMPYIVVIIDEFADLILTGKGDVEKPVTRLAQLARAVGIHLIVATQRPSVDIITGVIKANFPARISYRVASRVDSRTILDDSGADKLIGRGDMLFSEGGSIVRLQSPYISTGEIERIIDSIKDQF
jgi:hypothetical protein